jgi:hypothetical protein
MRADFKNVKLPMPINVGNIETASIMPKKLSAYARFGRATNNRAVYSNKNIRTVVHSITRKNVPYGAYAGTVSRTMARIETIVAHASISFISEKYRELGSSSACSSERRIDRVIMHKS